jgi:tRNA pseudouridine55 synthase
LVLVDKPAGVSSHDVVLAVRSAVGERRVGHAGTLDPFATGLLVILVGRATRLLQYLPGDPKVYEATIAFGTETDTDDLLGAPVRSAPLPALEAIRLALAGHFTGSFTQIPPSYSAKRIAGRRAYALARAGTDFAIQPVPVRVDSWHELEWNGTTDAVENLRVQVSCSGGTYVRALARDLGRLLGSAAHLSALRRVRSGPFEVAGAYTIADLRGGGVALRPALEALPDVPHQVLAPDEIPAVARGQEVPATVAGERAALVNPQNGMLVAYAERRGERWQPRAVMQPAPQPASP